MQIYVVKQGDTLYRIARRSGIPMEELIYVNQLQAPGVLCVGQSLLLPQPMTYTVQAGDSLYIIAHRYGLRLQELIAANPQLRDPDVLHPGQILALPQRPTEARTAVVNGYITNTSRQTLEQSLPSLTFLSAFSYHTDIAGKLKKEVTVPLSLSEEEGVRNLMTVTNLRGEGGFSGEIAHAVLTDTEAQDALVSNVLNTVEREGYAGVNLDFEYVFPHDRAAYNQFLARMSDALHRRKMILVTALAPKISDDQKGLLYEAHDYAFHGQAADYCILMTYEWGYTYSPPMAVAPLDRVRKVLDYAVTEIPRGKLLMGIPNYGYNWRIPFRKGEAAAALSNVRAVTLAGEVGAEIGFDETSAAPYYRYQDETGRQHEVWFEDARSLFAKLGLVEEYELAGVSFWNLNSLFRTLFETLQSMYRVEK